MFDVVALGELLIDFTPAGYSAAGNVLFERNPGGAPANVLAAVTKLGGSGAFIGKVGDDKFGYFLKETLEKTGIDAKGLKFSEDANTTLAFVHLGKDGDRSFSFYRRPGADTTLEEKDLDYSLIDEAGIFHFGSLSMTDEPARSSTIRAVEYAKSKGKIISYDPNWRPPLWKSEEAAKNGMNKGLRYADVLKISEVELEFLTGTGDLESGSRILYDGGIRFVIITLGPRGCYYRCTAGTGHLNTYNTKVIDTTGAGDAFLGAFLYRLCRLECKLDLSKQQIENMIDFSNAAGAVCASGRGAIPSMPSMPDVEKCIKTVPRLI